MKQVQRHQRYQISHSIEPTQREKGNYKQPEMIIRYVKDTEARYSEGIHHWASVAHEYCIRPANRDPAKNDDMDEDVRTDTSKPASPL